VTFLILTYIFVMAAKKRNFSGEKRDTFFSKIQHLVFCQKFEIFFGFSIVVQPNQGVQLKDRLF